MSTDTTPENTTPGEVPAEAATEEAVTETPAETPVETPAPAVRASTDRRGMPQGASVTKNEAANRYEIHVDGALGGFADYIASEGTVTIPHTEIDPAFEGRGLGSALARAAIEDIQGQGLHVIPQCPFIARYIDRHPEYASMVVTPPAPAATQE